MNFIVWLIIFFLFSGVKILKLKGSERSPSPTPGTSKESRNEERQIMTKLYSPKANGRKKGQKRKRSDNSDDEKENENNSIFMLSDELKKTAEDVMIAEKKKGKSCDEFISQCLFQLEEDTVEFVNSNILEGKYRVLLRTTIESLLIHILSSLNYCLSNAEKCIRVQADSWTPNSFINLKLIEKQIKELIKTIQIASDDIKNIFDLRHINMDILNIPEAIESNKILKKILINQIYDPSFIVLKSIINLKKKNVRAKTNEIFKLEIFLEKIKKNILFFNTLKDLHSEIAKEICKCITAKEALTIPASILLFYYNLRILCATKALKLKHEHAEYSYVFRRNKRLRKLAKAEFHCLSTLYKDKMKHLRAKFLNNMSYVLNTQELISMLSQDAKGRLITLTLHDLFYIIKNIHILKRLHDLIEKILLLDESPNTTDEMLNCQFHCVIPKEFENIINCLDDLYDEVANNMIICMLIQCAADLVESMGTVIENIREYLYDLQVIMERCAFEASTIKEYNIEPGESSEINSASTCTSKKSQSIWEKAKRRGKATEFFVTEDILSELFFLIEGIFMEANPYILIIEYENMHDGNISNIVPLMFHYYSENTNNY